MNRSSVSVSESNASEGSGLSTTLAKVDEMIAAGLILPMNFPDPGELRGDPHVPQAEVARGLPEIARD